MLRAWLSIDDDKAHSFDIKYGLTVNFYISPGWDVIVKMMNITSYKNDSDMPVIWGVGFNAKLF